MIKNKLLGIKFHSEIVYEYKYLKAKVRESDGAIRERTSTMLEWGPEGFTNFSKRFL